MLPLLLAALLFGLEGEVAGNFSDVAGGIVLDAVSDALADIMMMLWWLSDGCVGGQGRAEEAQRSASETYERGVGAKVFANANVPPAMTPQVALCLDSAFGSRWAMKPFGAFHLSMKVGSAKVDWLSVTAWFLRAICHAAR